MNSVENRGASGALPTRCMWKKAFKVYKYFFYCQPPDSTKEGRMNFQSGLAYEVFGKKLGGIEDCQIVNVILYEKW